MKSNILKPEQHYIIKEPCYQRIGEETRANLPHRCGAANYMVVNDAASLPIKVSDIYRKLTTRT